MGDDRADSRFLPGLHAIEGYGQGGFRFGGMSHRGSIIALPDGIRAWDHGEPLELTAEVLAPLLQAGHPLDIVLVGCGTAPLALPESVRWQFRARRTTVECLSTATAARTWNVLQAEGRRVGAALRAIP
jgi:uncharacterized protein